MQGKEVGKTAKAGEKSFPRVVVQGVVMSDGKGRGKKPYLAVLPLAFAFLLACAGGLLSSCSSAARLNLDAEGGARLDIADEVPPALAAKLRKLSSLPQDRALFNQAAATAKQGGKGIKVLSFSTPTPDSFVASLGIDDLAALAARKDLAQTQAITLSSKAGRQTLALHLERGNCRHLLDLMPGLDPTLIEALSPPALDPEPLTRAEYRSMLAGLLGEKATASLEAAKVEIEVLAPSPILASAGGKALGRSFRVELSCLDLLVLEKPLDFSITW